jgi:hypothetical protein
LLILVLYGPLIDLDLSFAIVVTDFTGILEDYELLLKVLATCAALIAIVILVPIEVDSMMV